MMISDLTISDPLSLFSKVSISLLAHDVIVLYIQLLIARHLIFMRLLKRLNFPFNISDLTALAVYSETVK